MLSFLAGLVVGLAAGIVGTALWVWFADRQFPSQRPPA